MKIGILTLPPTINYGGILQAFALQQTLNKLGHKAYLIDRRESPKTHIHYLNLRFRYAIHKILGNQRDWTFSNKKHKERELLLSQNTQTFISKYISPKTEAFDNSKKFSDIEKFDAYIVGSDQVWRPKYTSNIYDYYLEFLGNYPTKRIAYAASFGTDEWEYTKEETRKCSKLVAKFDVVSVREEEAVKLCQDKFNIEALHVLDPTLLLNKSDYLHYIDFSKTKKHNGDLMTYILDKDSEKRKFVDLFLEKTNYSEFNLALSNKDSKGNINAAPHVESWLQGFIDAKFVITDSFHGTVFSILFNKPFISIANKDRGLSRFSSLLKIFNLEDRLITSFEYIDEKKMRSKIDWNYINNILEKKREDSISFIKHSLDNDE